MQIKDSGTRDTFETGAVRDGQRGKGRFDLLPFEALQRVALLFEHAAGGQRQCMSFDRLPLEALQRVAVIFENGAEKYAPRNWEKGIPTHRYADSGLRHLYKHIAGHRDEDHIAMSAWNGLCLMQTEHWISTAVLPEELSTLPECFPSDAVSFQYAERLRRWTDGVSTHQWANQAAVHFHRCTGRNREIDHAAIATFAALCLLQTEHWIATGRLPQGLATLPLECSEAPPPGGD